MPARDRHKIPVFNSGSIKERSLEGDKLLVNKKGV